VIEEWKWRGVPVWSHAGIICTGEIYKNVVKMTFAKGAALEDPAKLFNSSLEGSTRRAIDLHEGVKVDEEALKALIRAAVALNTSSESRRGREHRRPEGFSCARAQREFRNQFAARLRSPQSGHGGPGDCRSYCRQSCAR
jgi:hypothetical protein